MRTAAKYLRNWKKSLDASHPFISDYFILVSGEHDAVQRKVCALPPYQMVSRVRGRHNPCGGGTSTVNLRVVRGDEMGLKKAAP
jgi:hypothetical protein